jgi:hypothetical protein
MRDFLLVITKKLNIYIFIAVFVALGGIAYCLLLSADREADLFFWVLLLF